MIVGNWKMNGVRASLDQIKAIAEGARSPLSEKVDLVLCPPVTLLYVATALCEDSPLAIGAQNCHESQSYGPHTGDIAAQMIADCLGTHVIVGHSERRRSYGETDARARAKAQAAVAAGLTAIVCIGETAEQRDAGYTLDVLKREILNAVPDGASAATTVIAYEPVWAIGTGLTPTPADISQAHALMRATLVERFGQEGNKFRLLYGGSANPTNARELISIENVNGLLVGSASLKAADFLAIYRAYEQFLV
jgi:triosephosphate isomerase